MHKKLIKKLKKIFASCPNVKLAYIFGSQAREDTGPLSDYDFAIYFDGLDKKEMFDVKLELQSKLSRALETDKVDVVVLNLSKKPELKYNIIKQGQLIFDREPYKVLVEPKIMNEYFDFHQMLKRHNLTKA